MRPVLLLEINEVPWRVVEFAKPRHRHLRRLFDSATTYTTISHDTGELSPWITWPSFHRGMNNTEHGIRVLGQDVATFAGTPIWEEYTSGGMNIGICGSLQSWPPCDPGKDGFFVPDTFAHDEKCFPKFVEPLQRFNLGQVRKNGRVIRKDTVGVREALRILPSVVRAKIRPATFRSVATQLVRERLDATAVARRPTFQALLYWDLFRTLFDAKNPPAFSTFFTNHVASVMHRYWNDVFPEDFPQQTRKREHAATMDFALDVLDDMIRDALEFQKARPDLLLVFGTSMGQAAVYREHEGYSAQIEDLAKFMSAFGLSTSDYVALLAMVPQVAADVAVGATRAELKADIEASTTQSGAQLFEIEQVGKTLSITIRTPSKADVKARGFLRRTRAGTKEFTAWEAAGISMHEVEAGSAYHIPEGVLAFAGEGIPANDARTRVALSGVKAMLLRYAGFPKSEVGQAARPASSQAVG